MEHPEKIMNIATYLVKEAQMVIRRWFNVRIPTLGSFIISLTPVPIEVLSELLPRSSRSLC